MDESQPLNDGGSLSAEISEQMVLAKKVKPLWARKAIVEETIESLEAMETVQPGDYVCRGIHGELWGQKSDKLLEKYSPSEEVETVDGESAEEGKATQWRRFDPKPDAPPVRAIQRHEPFCVQTSWGLLRGKAGDYLVQSTTDLTDVWVVDQAIFEATYQYCAE
ncbi:PGDYG domain-containing protein [Stieleria varia]|uniref:Uncharacterized protein n=1 Tax=Stieleria varia TaxID=2528005 RepID=A0A5C5ZZ43_9BACT|nr:PGDYG domain-containing protein [Stieleria varia]TWT92350.1 hypothetical protein Pla52n_62240 [Stieleria varia]